MLNFTVNPQLEWAYNCYLRGIGFIVLPLNLFTFYLIITKTPKHSYNYRWYLLHMQFWTTVLDLSVGLLFMPMPLFPLIGGYCSGILCRAGVPMHYGHVMAFVVNCAICTSFGMSIFYRHQLILPHGHWMRIGKGARSLLFVFTGLSIQMPAITAAFAKVDKAAAEQYLRVNHPAMLWLAEKPNWIVYDPEVFPVMWMVVETVAIILIYPTLYLLLSAHLVLGISKANCMSLKTRRLHIRIVRVLIIQVCAFSMFMFLPQPVIIYSTFNETVPHEIRNIMVGISMVDYVCYYIFKVNLLFFALMYLYSWSHSLILIAATPPYRAVFTSLPIRFRCPPRSRPSNEPLLKELKPTFDSVARQ